MSANQADPKEAAARLLAYLRQRKNDRGAMADLRCALNPTKLPRAWPLLARVGGIGNPRISVIGHVLRKQLARGALCFEHVGQRGRALAVGSHRHRGHAIGLLNEALVTPHLG